MIRAFKDSDLSAVMQIWFDTNVKAHNFIPQKYWLDNYAAVKEILPKAEVYVYEDDYQHLIMGFVWLTGNYVAGIFVKEYAQSKGVGKHLLDYIKTIKTYLDLSVYQKNIRAISFYKREKFIIQFENIEHSTNEKEFIMRWNK